MWNPRYFIAHLFTEGHVVKVNRSSWANTFNCYLLNNIIQSACEYNRLLHLPPLETLKRETLFRAKRPLKRLCFRRSFMRLHRSKSRLVDKSKHSYQPIRNFSFQENKNNNNKTPGQNYAEADTGNEDRSIWTSRSNRRCKRYQNLLLK